MASSDSAPPPISNRARIVPAIPLSFGKHPPTKRLATPEGSESSGQERRHENVIVVDSGVNSASAAPLTPESSNATTASSEHGGMDHTIQDGEKDAGTAKHVRGTYFNLSG